MYKIEVETAESKDTFYVIDEMLPKFFEWIAERKNEKFLLWCDLNWIPASSTNGDDFIISEGHVYEHVEELWYPESVKRCSNMDCEYCDKLKSFIECNKCNKLAEYHCSQTCPNSYYCSERCWKNYHTSNNSNCELVKPINL